MWIGNGSKDEQQFEQGAAEEWGDGDGEEEGEDCGRGGGKGDGGGG